MIFILIQIVISAVFAILGGATHEPIYWWVSGIAAGAGCSMLEQRIRMARNGA